jgi:UDP-N-acetyl-D-glucosamine dehydrogenase
VQEDDLFRKVAEHRAQVHIIGLGYVGLPLVVAFARAGYPVVGVDVDPQKIESLRTGHSYVADVSDDDLIAAGSNGLLRFTTDYGVLSEADAIIICVPTPLHKTKDPDISYILAAVEGVTKHLRAGQLIVLESTTYPGTTEEILLPRFEQTGLKVGQDFFLAFSPERIDPGNREYTITDIPKVIGGVTPACLRLAEQLYATVVDEVVPVSSPRAAEMAKLLENTFRMVNIALVNEMALMCDRLGVDVWEVIEAASTKPYGFMPFYPGPGLGGHCIPLDPHYLAWKLRTLNYNARFIQLANEVNTAMPHHVITRVTDALNDDGKSVRDSRILVLGVAYKRNIDDVRESPAIEIIEALEQRGARVAYHDPYVPTLRMPDGRTLSSVPLDRERLRWSDCTVIITDHDLFDWDTVVAEAPLLVDTRNATVHTQAHGARIVKL